MLCCNRKKGRGVESFIRQLRWILFQKLVHYGWQLSPCFVSQLSVNSAGKLPEMCPRKKRISNFLAERPRETGSVLLFFRDQFQKWELPLVFPANFSKLLSRICAWPCYFVGKFFPLFIIYMYDIQWIFLNNNLSFFFTLDTLEIIIKDLFHLYIRIF